ncbi:MAG: GAF domain-containing sensor histidine kinase [Chloroflexi bacterium]|nr:GAF domain-containing sensor histidine kinase [Chloroflexota bacterium]
MNLSFLARRGIFQPIMVAMKEQSQVSSWHVRLAWLILGLTVLLAVVELPLWPPFVDWYIAHFDLPYSPLMSMFLAGLNSCSFLMLALLGTLIIFAQPENRIGWLLSGSVFIATLSGLCEKYTVYAYVIAPERELPLRELALWIQHWVGLLVLPLLFVALPLLFPNGRLPSKRWRWFARGAIGVTGLMLFIMAFHPDVQIEGMFLLIENDLSNPYGIAALPISLLLLLYLTWILTLLVILPIACLSLVVRYRAADTTTRQQIKWFSLWLAIVIVLFVVRHFNGLTPNTIDEIALRTAILCLPIVLGISLFKYHLYDIDIIINRTLVYGLLTIIIVGLYILIVGLLGTVFQARGDLLASLVATGVVALSFHSVREQMQRGVNRLMFGQRDEPYSILSRLGQQLKTVTEAKSLLPTVVETVAVALKLPYAAITIQQHDQFGLRASYGQAKTPTHSIPLIYQNEKVGQLIVGQRSPGEPLTPADKRVLEDIARQMGAVVHSVRLTSDLQQSRERLVTAREEERRRLRRDLHDGLGPALASQTLKLDATIDLIEADPQAAIQLLKKIKAQSQTLVADVRRLVYDLRPPALDELGLVAALRSHISQLNPIQNGLTITIEAPNKVPTLSAAVQVAAYRIGQEAVLNVLKHAHARHCTLRLSIVPDESCLQIEVIDDGIGLPHPVMSGVGLQSMRERAEELSGSFVCRDALNGGTHIQARLPVMSGEVIS